MTKQEAYKTCQCRHCSSLDYDTGECICGDPESEICPKSYSEEEDEDTGVIVL